MSALAHEMCRGAFFFGDGGEKESGEIRGIRDIRDIIGLRESGGIRGIRGLGDGGEEFDFSDSFDGSDSWLLSLGDLWVMKYFWC